MTYQKRTEAQQAERIAALEAELARVTKEREEAMETRDFFANRLNEALGALGYEVPGDTPQGRYRCGMCGPKDAALLDAEHEWALWFEKWKAALDLMGSQADRANRAEQACKRTWERAIEAAADLALDLGDDAISADIRAIPYPGPEEKENG